MLTVSRLRLGTGSRPQLKAANDLFLQATIYLMLYDLILPGELNHLLL